MAEKKSPKKNIEYKCPVEGCEKTCKSKAGLSLHKKNKHPEYLMAEKAHEGQVESRLTPQEEDFCQFYASDREFFGNGTQSYIEAFNVQVVHSQRTKVDVTGEILDDSLNKMTYDSVRNAAYRLLTNAHILKRINEIYEARGLNDTFVDKQLEFLITQQAELPTKIKAIAEYNKLKQRTTSSSVSVDHTFAKYDNMTDEELARELEKGEKFFKKT